MRVEEGQRIRLTGRAWGVGSREVYARVTFVDHAYAKLDDQEILVSGSMVNGYEFELAPFPPVAYSNGIQPENIALSLVADDYYGDCKYWSYREDDEDDDPVTLWRSTLRRLVAQGVKEGRAQ
ncbi:hypothetical protein MRBLMI12_000472 [Microbacterium sp. LMI12-1-1.1]|uniref:hypothetical protein n=1 Tax=Microbacterium sp. LMI12-1-1.1 TaxID=3135225 RepID=UPI00342C2A14